MAATHKHVEAYKLMKYASDDGSLVEMIWNSRDGVTPFILFRDEGKTELRHVEWHKDVYAPHWIPAIGSRIFVDLTPEKAKEYATRRIEQCWDDPEVRARWPSKEAAIEEAAKDMLHGGEAPDVIVVDKAWLVARFGGLV